MSELPSLVRVKRKRGADPTPDLFLEERSTKRPQTWQFRLQQPHPNDNEAGSTQAQTDLSQASQEENDVSAERREFRLAISRERLQNLPGQKRKAQLDVQNIPTFVEATKKRKFAGRANKPPAASAEGQEAKDQPSTALKRPTANAKERQWRAETWKQSDKATAGASPIPQPDSKLVDALTRFAMEEEARDEARTKPKVASIPKRPVQRYKDRHPEEFAARTAQPPTQNGSPDVDMDMELDPSDDEDYVYDTYVRTKEPVMLPTMDNGDSAHDKIGYLVITEQDQPFWETYFEDEASENEFDTDDEDENGKIQPPAK